MSKNTVYFSTTGWECPVCHKGCAPQALKCEHCAEAAQMKSINRGIIGQGFQPAQAEKSPHGIPAELWGAHIAKAQGQA